MPASDSHRLGGDENCVRPIRTEGSSDGVKERTTGSAAGSSDAAGGLKPARMATGGTTCPKKGLTKRSAPSLASVMTVMVVAAVMTPSRCGIEVYSRAAVMPILAICTPVHQLHANMLADIVRPRVAHRCGLCWDSDGP